MHNYPSAQFQWINWVKGIYGHRNMQLKFRFTKIFKPNGWVASNKPKCLSKMIKNINKQIVMMSIIMTKEAFYWESFQNNFVIRLQQLLLYEGQKNVDRSIEMTEKSDSAVQLRRMSRLKLTLETQYVASRLRPTFVTQCEASLLKLALEAFDRHRLFPLPPPPPLRHSANHAISLWPLCRFNAVALARLGGFWVSTRWVGGWGGRVGFLTAWLSVVWRGWCLLDIILRRFGISVPARRLASRPCRWGGLRIASS